MRNLANKLKKLPIQKINISEKLNLHLGNKLKIHRRGFTAQQVSHAKLNKNEFLCKKITKTNYSEKV